MADYLSSGGRIPVTEVPEECLQQGLVNLQAVSELDAFWRSPCWEPLGMHLLATLWLTMGTEPWKEAIRDMNRIYGHQGLYYASSSNSPKDEDIYRIFLGNTPPQLVPEVKEVFRRLHGGHFVD